MPAVAFAQFTNFKAFIELLLKIIQNIITILFVALAVGIIFGIAMYMLNLDNEKKREELKGYLLWAIIGAVVVVGMWAFVEILTMTLFGAGIGIPFLSTPTN
ncbi:MAG: hypothetical protein UY04_C0012G0030 [Parcubacteria group bacterium GW2011_GWA2_47_7]|nr:MAG: hypothetical protein UY04_C0012G0030 [Parcubacteria group bacterium GW2011_GWA2_47_7]